MPSRYYAGIYEMVKVKGPAKNGAAEAIALEDHPDGRFKAGETVICPNRLLWRRRRKAYADL